MKVLGLLSLCLFVALPSFSQAAPEVVLLTKSQIQALIGDFPARGSQDEAADDQVLLDWQNKRTKADCAFAASQENVTIKTFFGRPNGPLSDAEINSLPLSISTQTKVEIGANTQIAKTMFDRPRPFLRNPLIKPCIKLPGGYAYPSGHATFAYAMGKILAARYP